MKIFFLGIPSFLALDDPHPAAITVVCHCYWYPYTPTIISGPFIDAKPWRRLELALESNKPRLNESKLTASHFWPHGPLFPTLAALMPIPTIVPYSILWPHCGFSSHNTFSRKEKNSQNRGTKMNRRRGGITKRVPGQVRRSKMRALAKLKQRYPGSGLHQGFPALSACAVVKYTTSNDLQE